MPQWRKLWTKTPESLDVDEMPSDTHRLFWVLLPLALDREGRGLHNPAWLKSHVFPLRMDLTAAQVGEMFAWFVERGMVETYEVAGRGYFYVPTFAEYQGDTSKEAESLYPPPPGQAPEPVVTDAGATDDEEPDDAESTPEQVESSSRVTPELLQSYSRVAREQVGSRFASDADADTAADADADTAATADADTRARASPRDGPVAAADFEESVRLLSAFGIDNADTLARASPLAHVRGWIEIAKAAGERLESPTGLVVARLRAGIPPPAKRSPEEDAEGWRRFVCTDCGEFPCVCPGGLNDYGG